jgi:hypothetical protein
MMAERGIVGQSFRSSNMFAHPCAAEWDSSASHAASTFNCLAEIDGTRASAVWAYSCASRKYS